MPTNINHVWNFVEYFHQLSKKLPHNQPKYHSCLKIIYRVIISLTLSHFFLFSSPDLPQIYRSSRKKSGTKIPAFIPPIKKVGKIWLNRGTEGGKRNGERPVAPYVAHKRTFCSVWARSSRRIHTHTHVHRVHIGFDPWIFQPEGLDRGPPTNRIWLDERTARPGEPTNRFEFRIPNSLCGPTVVPAAVSK